MPHFFSPAKNRSGNKLFFESEESYHLSKVLRKKNGDIIQVFDGQGPVLKVQLTDVSNPKKVTALILETNNSSDLPSYKSQAILTIYPALLKGERFEWMLEKATELGVQKICPILTERTIVKLKNTDKVNRWEKICLNAAKQSGRTTFPELTQPKNISQLLKELKEDEHRFILWEGEETNSLSHLIQELKMKNTHPPKISLLIGPEGGFTLKEAGEAISLGWKPARLVGNILRAETATISAASIVLL